MKGINKEDIINEDKEIVDYEIIEKIVNSGIKKCICKIKQEIDSKKCKKGTGFFCNIKEKNIKIFVTNNHVLDQEFLNKEKKLIVFIDEEKKEIDLEINRYKLTDIELDFTIIEILEEDKIENYLEIDEYINSEEYKEEQIFTIQYPGGEKLKYSHGKIIEKIDNYFTYSLGTEGGSSGSPIILIDNLKLIGLHKGKYKEKEKIGIGIPINLVINKFNFIKCIYNIKKSDIGKEIHILNNGWYHGGIIYKKENYEIEYNIKVLIKGEMNSCIFKYKFNKEGKYNIYFIPEKTLTNLSYMFHDCECLEEINLLSFNTNNVTNMQEIFGRCKSLKKINLSSLNTINVINMSWMFNECLSLKEINFSSFNTKNVKDMSWMFHECLSLKEIDLSSFDTNNVTNMECMFHTCSSLKYIDSSSFNTNNVTNMSSMFKECSSLKEINLSSFTTNNKISVYKMFNFVPKFSKLICDDKIIIEEFNKNKCFIF